MRGITGSDGQVLTGVSCVCEDHELSAAGGRRLLEALQRTVQVFHYVLIVVVEKS